MMPTTKELLGGAVAQSLNVLRETANRVPGLVDAGASVAGVRPYKKLLLRVVILRDEEGKPLASEEAVVPSFLEAQRVFLGEARVRALPAGRLVQTLDEPAPTAALDVHCDDGAWQEDFARTGDFFRHHSARDRGRFLGYGVPVTVFVVRDISNKGGCSLGPLTDYVTVEAGMLLRARYRLIAHEVAHACGLWHSKDKENLMFPKGPGDKLAGWQAAILRNSRHVTLL
jgi:hypothetical protein